jgi:hypothetical protein
LPYPSIERHWLILNDDANVRASSARHRRTPSTVSMPLLLNAAFTSFPRHKKIACPDATKRLVNVTFTMPPTTSISAAG